MGMGKKSEHFQTAVLVIIILIVLFVSAFLTEDNNISGAVVYGDGSSYGNNGLKVLAVSSLSELAEGNYYIDASGIVYWTDDSSRPAVAKIAPVREIYTDRYLYVDGDGAVFYNG